MLRFLGDQALGHPGAPIKEYQIATEVFGRAADFDPRLDSTVRVQTGRLRAKLSEYYAGEGHEDQLIIDIPKGAYSIALHERERSPEAGPKPVTVPDHPVTEPAGRRQIMRIAVWILAILCVGLAAALLRTILLAPTNSAAKTEDLPPVVIREFWKGFLDREDQPWVVFSNAEFIGRPETGIRYFVPKRDNAAQILDHYTGVGEVLAIHELDRLFSSLNQVIRVKRGRLLSLDDAKNKSLIFVGSPSENLKLRDIPSTQDFVFHVSESGPRKGDLAIVNNNPQPGEAATYFGTATVPLLEDYAVIGMVPGMSPNRRVMVLAGLTTLGTQAAAEFVCHENSLQALLARTRKKAGDAMPFEAVIRVRVSGGVPVQSDLVAVHTH